jgi:hypothetical protein
VLPGRSGRPPVHRPQPLPRSSGRPEDRPPGRRAPGVKFWVSLSSVPTLPWPVAADAEHAANGPGQTLPGWLARGCCFGPPISSTPDTGMGARASTGDARGGDRRGRGRRGGCCFALPYPLSRQNDAGIREGAARPPLSVDSFTMRTTCRHRASGQSAGRTRPAGGRAGSRTGRRPASRRAARHRPSRRAPGRRPRRHRPAC